MAEEFTEIPKRKANIEPSITHKKLKKKRKHDNSEVDLPVPNGSTKKHKKPRSHDILESVVPLESMNSTSASNSSCSPFRLVTTALYLPLSPLYSHTPHHSVESDHLDSLILTYYPPLRGIILGYKNLTFKQCAARIANDSPFAYTWVSVDFLVYSPGRGMILEGWINLMSESHIGLLVLNTFNASIPREKIPETWKWVEDRGCYRNLYSALDKKKKVRERKEVTNGMVEADHIDGTVNGDSNADAGKYLAAEEEGNGSGEEQDNGGWIDSQGNNVDGLLRFKVDTFKASGHIISIIGSLLDLPQSSTTSLILDTIPSTSMTEILPDSQPEPSGELPSHTAKVTEPANNVQSPKKKNKKEKRKRSKDQ